MIDGSEDLTKPSPLIDGYQIVNITAVISAILIYWFFLRPATLYLQAMDVSSWRIKYQGHTAVTAYEMVGHLDDD